MFYLLYLETKGLLKQFVNSLNIKKNDCLIYFMFVLTLVFFGKVAFIFKLKLGYIVLLLFFLAIVFGSLEYSKQIVEIITSKKNNESKIYPINNFKLISIKMFRYEILALVQYLFVAIPLYLILAVVGYDLYSVGKSFIFSINVFLFFYSIISLFKVGKIKFESQILKVIMGVVYISIPYLFIFYSNKAISFLIDVANNSTNLKLVISKISVLDLFYNIVTIKKYLIMLFMYVLLTVIRLFIYKSISQNNKKENNKFKIKLLEKYKCNNIVVRKEVSNLLLGKFDNFLFFRIISYSIFAIMLIVFKYGFGKYIEIKYNLLLFVFIFDISKVSEEITKNYIGKEKKYILQYMFSDYSLINVLKNRIKIYSFILIIYTVFIEIIMGLSVNENIHNILLMIILSVPIIINFIFTNELFNTYKTSYINELAIPNKKSTFIKVICEAILCYLMLPIIIFVPYIPLGNYVALIQITLVYFVNIIYFIILMIFTKTKEGELYGEFKYAIFKKQDN